MNSASAQRHGIKVQELKRTFKTARANIVKSMVKTLSAAIVQRSFAPKGCETTLPTGEKVLNYFIGEAECVSIVNKVPPKNPGVIFFSRNEREHTFGLCGMRVSGPRVKEGGSLAVDTNEFMPRAGGTHGPASLLVGLVIPNPRYDTLSVKYDKPVAKFAFKWWIEGNSIVAFLQAVMGGDVVVLNTLRQQLRQSAAPHDELFAGYRLIVMGDIDYFVEQNALPETDRELSLSVDPIAFMVRVAMASDDDDLIGEVVKRVPSDMKDMVLREPHAGSLDPLDRVGQSSDTLLLDHCIYVEGLSMSDAESALGLRPHRFRQQEVQDAVAAAAAAAAAPAPASPPCASNYASGWTTPPPTDEPYAPTSPLPPADEPYVPTSPLPPADEPYVPASPPPPPPTDDVDPNLAAFAARFNQ
jgi:hypothetical protein